MTASSGLPVAGARITVQGMEGALFTDPSGSFAFPVPTSGTYIVYITKAGFVDVKRGVQVIAGRDAVVEPSRLVALDAKETLIVASEGGVHGDSTGLVTVELPPGALAHDLAVSGTVILKAEDFPVPLPPGQAFLGGVQFEPAHTQFAQSVTVRFANRFGLPPGTAVPFAFAKHHEGEGAEDFFDPGMGQVSGDGSVVEIRLLHFSCIALAVPASAPDGSGLLQVTRTGTKDSANLPQKCQSPGCQIGVDDGELSEEITLPAVRGLGVSRALTLTYTSLSAFSTAALITEALLPPAITKVPEQLRWRLRIGSNLEEVTVQGARTGRFAFLWEAKDGTGQPLPTGSYPLVIDLLNVYSGGTLATTDTFGGGPLTSLGFPSPEPVALGVPAGGRVVVRNQRASPFGTGWGLQGLHRLLFDPDGFVTLVDGSGLALVFTPGPRLDPSFVPPAIGGPFAVEGMDTLYIVDPFASGGGRLFRARPGEPLQLLTTLAGPGTPGPLFLDGPGRLLVGLSASPSRLVAVDLTTGRTSDLATFPDSGLRGLARDRQGTLFVATNSRILRQTTDGTFAEVARVSFIPLAGNGLAVAPDGAFLGLLGTPEGIGLLRILPSGQSSFLASLPGGLSAVGLAADLEGNVYVSVQGPLRGIYRVSPQGTVHLWTTEGFGGAPFSLAVNATGDLFVHDGGAFGKGILRYTVDGTRFLPPEGDVSTLLRDEQGTPDPADDQFIRRLKDGTQFVFDLEGRHLATVDRNGNSTTYTSDAEGRVLTVTDPVGQTWTLAYEGTGKLSTITDPAGRVTRFAHNADGNLISVTFPDEATQHFTYDARHLLTSVMDPRGFVKTYTYDAYGRLAQISYPTGETRTFQVAEVQGLLNDLPPGTGTPENPAVLPAGGPTRLTDGRGFTTRIQTDALGRVTQTTDPLGRVTALSRSKDLTVVTVVQQPNGLVTRLTEDRFQNLLEVLHEGVGATRFTYGPFAQVTSLTDPKGNVTRLTYDAQGNPTQITDALNNPTTLTYDSRGLLTSTTDALGQTTTFTHDAKGHLIQTTDPLGNITTLAYDAAGNVITSTDALGRETQFAYDPMNRLTSVTDAAGGITSYTYDAAGNLLAVTDANGQTTTFEYDGVNQLTRTTNPLGQTKTFMYDLARNLISTTDAMGQTITFEYDAANQLGTKRLPTGEVVTFAYDLAGNLTFAQDADSKLTFTYDKLSRLLSTTTGGPGLEQPQVTLSVGSYDGNGNRQSLVSPAGTLTYTYDALNRVTTLQGPAGTFTFTYDALSRRTGVTFPNGTQTTYTYDPASQLLSLVHKLTSTGSPLASFSYTYDEVGNRTTLTELNRARSYTYDALNRLLQATHPTLPTPETFSYDPVGNRLSASGVTATFDAANRLMEDTNSTYTYDANGNLITQTDKATGEVTTYSYDAENQLIHVSKPGMTATYRYDALGRRIEKNVNGVITRYIYDNEDILLEYDGSNQIIARYTHGPGIDEPLAMQWGGQTVFYSFSRVTGKTGVIKAKLLKLKDFMS